MKKLSSAFIQKVWDSTSWEDLNPLDARFSMTTRERFAQKLVDSLETIRIEGEPALTYSDELIPRSPDNRKGYIEGFTEGKRASFREIRQAIKDYHYALDMRQHGGEAEAIAFKTICKVLDMSWKQGQEKVYREEQ